MIFRMRASAPWRQFFGIALAFACGLLATSNAHAQANLPLQRVQGNAADIAITPDGTVHVIDTDGKPWVQRLGRGANWSPLQGNFRAVRAGLDGSVWAIARDDVAFHLNGTAWRELPFGKVRDLAAFPALTPDGTVLVLTQQGSLEIRTTAGQVLYKMEDEAFRAAGFERILVDEHGLPWAWRTGGLMWRFDGTRWVELAQFAATGLTSVSAGLDGTLMAVARGGQAFRWNAAARQWVSEPLAGPVQLVAIGPSGKPWFVTQDNTLLASEVFANQGSLAPVKPAALFTRLLSWRRVRGEAGWLSVGADGSVVTIDPENSVWRWKGGNTWTPLPGKFRRVSVAGNGVVWGVDLQNRLQRNANGQWNEAGIEAAEVAAGPREQVWVIGPGGNLARYDAQIRQWVAIPGGPAKSIAVGKDGEAWIIDTSGVVQLLNPATPFPGIVAASLGIGPEGTVYATTPERQLYWLDPRERQWKPATGVASAVAVGPAGTPWIIGERNELQVSSAFIAEFDAIVAARAAQVAPPPPVFSIPPPAASSLPTNNRPLTYTAMTGAYADVGISPEGAVFAAGTDGGLYCFSNPDRRFVLASTGSARRVAVAGGGVPWVINALGQVAFFGATGWVIVPNIRADDIAVGQDGNIYATQQNVVYRYTPATQDFREVTTYTSGVPLRARRIAFAQNALWGVNTSNQLIKCDGTQCQPQSIGATDVASGPDGSVVVLDANGAVQRYNSRTRGFAPANGTGTAIAVGPQGLPWVVTATGTINSSGLFATSSKSINQSACAQRFASAVIPITQQATAQLTANNDDLTIRPGASTSIIANDRLNGNALTTSSITITFSTASSLLTHSNGLLSLGNNAVPGTVLTGTYTICALPSGVPCSRASVRVTVGTTITAGNDSFTLSLGQQGSQGDLATNDFLSGRAASTNPNNFTYTLTPANPDFQLNGTNLALANPQLQPNTYSVPYRVCEAANTANCATATATVRVVP